MTMHQRNCPELRRKLFRELAPRSGYRAGNLATLCGVSLRQLERYFRSDFDCPPGPWLREKRIRTACRLLDHDLSVKEVAFALGFGSVSHFSSQFKRATGVCPSEYSSASHEEPAPLGRQTTRGFAILSHDSPQPGEARLPTGTNPLR